MINLKLKDIKKRKIISKYENSKLIFNLINSNNNFEFLIQYNLAQFKNKKISRNTCVARLSKRCVLTNNNKILNSHFKLSRYMFLKFARFNSIFGLKKSYW